MTNFYKSYLRAFQKFAHSSLERASVIKTITRYALILNIKANQLLRRAALNKMVDLPRFQKELFETGRDYVKKFSTFLRQKKAGTPEQKSGEKEIF